VQTIAELTAESHDFGGLDSRYLELIAGCGSTVRFRAGERLFRSGDAAERFYLVRHGTVALELYAAGHHPLTIQTLHDGEIAGFSWLFEPYQWMFDARAVADTSAIAFDAVCLRGKCEADHELGYQLMRRFAGIALSRLQATRLQLQDVYGRAG
jgi:CRP/FNR family transcriptional regulator, cyclic AMP receptor protein